MKRLNGEESKIALEVILRELSNRKRRKQTEKYAHSEMYGMMEVK
jgi:aromatic ring-opening dioxygenase LigB subunit